MGKREEESDLRSVLLMAKRVREAQRTYFNHRTAGALDDARRMERQFDRELERVLADGRQQSFAFGGSAR
jgi:hypothetical protein